MSYFTQLQVWKKGLLLVVEVYRLSKSFPPEERYAMTSQIRKASTSILANVAEGASRYTFADKAAKFVIARGECAEVGAFLHVAVALKFLTISDIQIALQLQDEVTRMLSGLISGCRKRS
jgi:four helix bundle protein